MKKLILVLGLGLYAVGLGAAASETPATVAAQLEASPPADLDAFYAIRTRMGVAGIVAIRKQLDMDQKQAFGGHPPEPLHMCSYSQWYVRDLAGLGLAEASSSDAEWAGNRDQVIQALAGRQEAHDRVMAGEKVDPAYDNTALPKAIRAATYPAESRARELAVRAANDQFWRSNMIVMQRGSLWAAGLTPAALAYMRGIDGPDACRVDQANQDWLKADIAANGWPKLSVYGKATAGDAYIIVQHADADIEFQRHVLALMEALLSEHEVSGSDYAYLYDRVARNSGMPGRYGTQGGCTDKGQWEPDTTEDVANLDTRRAGMGLEPEAGYKARMSPKCSATLAK